jgi:hypothetical protein
VTTPSGKHIQLDQLLVRMFEFGGGVRRFDFELFTVSLEDVSRKVIIFLSAEPAADLTRRASQLHQCAVQIEYSDTLLEVNYGYSSRNIRYYVSSLGQVADRGCRAARTKPPGGPVLKSLL